ncbi:MAG: diguanylate cyclase [Hahellaceae bacterium]|nr:diguanylate cyclase [Hahellaceae bacterium]
MRRVGEAISVRSGITLLFGMCVVVLIILLTTLIERTANQKLLRERSVALHSLAYQVADKLDKGLFERLQDLRIASSTSLLISATKGEPEKARRWFNELRTAVPIYAWIGFANPEGQVLASVNGWLEGANVADRPWFEQGRNGEFLGDVHKAVLLANLLPSRPEPWRFVDIALPIRDSESDLIGVLGAHLSWDWVEEISFSVLSPVLSQDPVEAVIVDKGFDVLMGSADLSGKNIRGLVGDLPSGGARDAHILQWPDQNDYLTSIVTAENFAQLQSLGWTIVVRQPKNQALASSLALQQKIITWGCLIGALFLWLVWLLSGWITHPLRRLAHSAGQFAQHKQTVRFRGRLYQESFELAESLNAMVNDILSHEQALQNLNQSLEHRVQERTEHLQSALKALGDSQHTLKTITDNIPVLVAYADHNERIVFANATALEWLNLDAEVVSGKTIQSVLSDTLYASLQPAITRVLKGESLDFEQQGEGRLGQHHYHVNFIVDRDMRATVRGFYIMATDISEHVNQEAWLEWQIQHDALTGALNRKGMLHHLGLAIKRGSRSERGIAVMFIDLDHFKQVNDTYGHDAGDLLLKQITDRLSHAVRQTDSVARVAGDEFVIILEETRHIHAHAEGIATKIYQSLQEPVTLSSTTALTVTASIGVAICGQLEASTDPADLLKEADIAMYEAKQRGKNQFVIREFAE